MGRISHKLSHEYPELRDWFMDEAIFDQKSTTSACIVKVKCPDCGHVETISIRNFTKRTNKCLNCTQDGISRPNKFLREFLKEIESQTELIGTEWNPKWAKLYSYDGHIIIKGMHYAIEMHGEQHYHPTGRWNFQQQQQRDLEKIELAKENNVKLIVINCTKTDYKSIKDNILNSDLAKILDLSNIDWYAIISKSTKNYVKVISDLYKEGNSIANISKLMMLDRHTISRMLLDGNELGWCSYQAISCRELCKINVRITNVNTQNSVVIHRVNEATKFIFEDSGYKIDRHTIHNYIQGYYYEYYNNKKYAISLKDKLYKNIYKFEYLDGGK